MNTHEQRHRGKNLNDKALFSGEQLFRLHDAVYELCWLLDRGYARPSAIKLVGDHHQLAIRQRLAISRAACSSVNRKLRITKCLYLSVQLHGIYRVAIEDEATMLANFNQVGGEPWDKLSRSRDFRHVLLRVCCNHRSYYS
jgi:hypothetical protein